MLKNHSGYSLLEILIVLSILTITAAISLPAYHYFYEQSEATLQQSQLLSLLHFAKQQASIRGIPIVMCGSDNYKNCNSAWAGNWLVFTDEKELGIVQNKNQILLSMQPGKQGGKLHWRGFPKNRQYLLFASDDDREEGNNGTFWYCLAATSYPSWALVLNRAGRERILLPDKNGKIKDSQGKILACGA